MPAPPWRGVPRWPAWGRDPREGRGLRPPCLPTCALQSCSGAVCTCLQHLPTLERSFSCPQFILSASVFSQSAPLSRSLSLVHSPPIGVAHSLSPRERCARCSGWKRAWLLTRKRLREEQSPVLQQLRSLRLRPLPHPNDPVCPRCPKDRAFSSAPPGLHFEMTLSSGTFRH